jgi:thiamine biosynthesis protein ThiS
LPCDSQVPLISTMQITVNGERIELSSACTIDQLLQQRKLAASPCAVEVNRKVISHRQRAQCMLNDGDQVEIVTLVGGG